MICYKNSFATEAVRRYLLQLIAKSGPEPERLPPERELAERLHLSRVTVRRAIEELENMSYILRLPGRKGAFTNPAVASEVEHTIGIVVYQNYVGQIFSQFLSGLSGELYRCGHHYNFSLFQRSGSSASQVAFELENSGYDCIVWHTQAPEDLEVIRLLHLHKFPVFTLCNPNFPEWGMAPGQNYGLDMQQAGEAQAAFLLKKQCRKPGLCCSGGVSAMTEAFQRKLAENGVSAGAENFFCSAGSFLDCLDVLLEKGMDGICCSLGEPQILALLAALSAHEKAHRIPILLQSRNFSIRCRAEYKHLQIFYPDTSFYQEQCLALGSHLAHGIISRLKTGVAGPDVLLPACRFAESEDV